MRCHRSRIARIAAVAALALATSLGHASVADQDRAWRFKVFLDAKPIGWHTFELTHLDGTLRSRAQYDVKFMFVTAYSYLHEATEVWDGRCLARVNARTDDNGALLSLEGRRAGEVFLVQASGGREQLPGCVQSFAYWDPSILRAKRLLNAQTGEYLDVETVHLGRQQITVRGATVFAQAWRIKTRDFQIDLWYSDDDQWLALQSPTKGGRVLRYEIQ